MSGWCGRRDAKIRISESSWEQVTPMPPAVAVVGVVPPHDRGGVGGGGGVVGGRWVMSYLTLTAVYDVSGIFCKKKKKKKDFYFY